MAGERASTRFDGVAFDTIAWRDGRAVSENRSSLEVRMIRRIASRRANKRHQRTLGKPHRGQESGFLFPAALRRCAEVVGAGLRFFMEDGKEEVVIQRYVKATGAASITIYTNAEDIYVPRSATWGASWPNATSAYYQRKTVRNLKYNR